MTSKTIIVDIAVHNQIKEYQKEVKKLMGYELQIKEIVVMAVNQYIKTRTEVLTFPKKE